jgi:hypothetical protein
MTAKKNDTCYACGSPAKRLSICLPINDYELVKALADKIGLQPQNVVRGIVQEYFEKQTRGEQ